MTQLTLVWWCTDMDICVCVCVDTWVVVRTCVYSYVRVGVYISVWLEVDHRYVCTYVYICICSYGGPRHICVGGCMYFEQEPLIQCPRSVMVKAMNCGIVVREFVLQSRYYVHFRANTLGKCMNPLILPPAMGK